MKAYNYNFAYNDPEVYNDFTGVFFDGDTAVGYIIIDDESVYVTLLCEYEKSRLIQLLVDHNLKEEYLTFLSQD